MRIRKQYMQLELYYPKNTYDRFARREMKAILTRFNDLYYEAYPGKLKTKFNALINYEPRTHSKQYEVQRAIKLCKSKKIRRKDIVKIEEYLNLQYIIEEQLIHYNNELIKVKRTKQLLSQEKYASFFPELFEERMKFLSQIEANSLTQIDKLKNEKQICEKAIRDLIDRNHSFWGDAGKLIGSMISESVKHVVDVVDQSFRRK